MDDPEVVFPTVLGHEGSAVHNTAKVEDCALTSAFDLLHKAGEIRTILTYS